MLRCLDEYDARLEILKRDIRRSKYTDAGEFRNIEWIYWNEGGSRVKKASLRNLKQGTT